MATKTRPALPLTEAHRCGRLIGKPIEPGSLSIKLVDRNAPAQFPSRTAAWKDTQAITASLIEREASMLDAFGRWQPVSSPARPDIPQPRRRNR